MSDDLVKRLLTEVTVGTGRVTHLRKEAADRIEELEAERNAWKEAHEALYDITTSGGFRYSTEAQDIRLAEARAALTK